MTSRRGKRGNATWPLPHNVPEPQEKALIVRIGIILFSLACLVAPGIFFLALTYSQLIVPTSAMDWLTLVFGTLMGLVLSVSGLKAIWSNVRKAKLQ